MMIFDFNDFALGEAKFAYNELCHSPRGLRVTADGYVVFYDNSPQRGDGEYIREAFLERVRERFHNTNWGIAAEARWPIEGPNAGYTVALVTHAREEFAEPLWVDLEKIRSQVMITRSGW